MNLKDNKRIADYWAYNPETEKVDCSLCPRHCSLKAGQDGFCLVRGNIDDKLYTFNYGQSIEATIETIETEAVYHYSPGAKILSMGNVGCMMACSFCQNWQTSQIKHLNTSNVRLYSPQEVIDIALQNNIEIISWTYNDPVVWQEFVVETSKLAQKNGIKTLYKSALYIESEPLAELIEVIDIFSISLKSMDDELYRKITKGRLQPVLDAIEQIHRSDRHLEISQLIVTDLNDNEADAKATAEWIVQHLGTDIPLHFVAYHPSFRYTKPRTPVEKLIEARNIAIEAGIEYCYLGNVYHDDVSNTFCQSCDNLLVQRFGLTVHNKGLDANHACTNCGTASPISGKIVAQTTNQQIEPKIKSAFEWIGDVNSVHIIGHDHEEEAIRFNIIRQPSNTVEYYELNGGIERLILSKSSDDETSIDIWVDRAVDLKVLPVLDRAHFPVINPSKNAEKYLN